MSKYQVYLNDEQKNYLLKYMRDRRYVSIMIMITSFVLVLVGCWLCNNNIPFLSEIKGTITTLLFFSLISFKSTHEKRPGKIIAICVLVLCALLMLNSGKSNPFSYDTQLFLDKIEVYVSVVASTGIFITEFVKGFGRTFGHKCDIQCIENGLYTLDYADFGYREKDTGKHPYYICDNRGETYICPRFLDYRNADTGGHFLYIKLDNGRGYAIADD